MIAAETILESPMPTEGHIADELAARVSRATVIRRDEPLAKHTTLRIGGPADVYVEPASEVDLANILKFCAERDVPFFILGRGSNLLVRDGGVRGVVACLAHPHFSRIEIVGERLHCGAGAKLKNVSVEARRNNLSGVEFLEGIPGSVGGALRMNAGAIHERVAGEVPVEYRACPLLKTHIALGAVLKCTPLPRAEIEHRMKAYNEKRWESQPAAPSAGCIFKNPGTIPAGKLVDELGLKGTRVGGAVVSAEHGNFIVNDGHATARDVLELIAILKAKAKTGRGIELHTEVEIIGEEIS